MIAILLLTYVYISLHIAYIDFIDCRSSKEGYLRSRQRLLLILFTIILFIINTVDLVNTFELLVFVRKALMQPLIGGIDQQFEVADNALIIWTAINPWPVTLEVEKLYLSLFIMHLFIVL